MKIDGQKEETEQITCDAEFEKMKGKSESVASAARKRVKALRCCLPFSGYD